MESGEKVVVTRSEKVEKSRAGDIDDDDMIGLLMLYDFIVFCIYINLCVGLCSPISLMLSLLHHLSSNPTKSQEGRQINLARWLAAGCYVVCVACCTSCKIPLLVSDSRSE